jgi:hypothetical protein
MDNLQNIISCPENNDNLFDLFDRLYYDIKEEREHLREERREFLNSIDSPEDN